MEDNVYKIEDYYKLLELQKKYDDDLIDEDDLTLQQIDDLIELYKYQIKKMTYENKKAIIKRKEENND